MDDASAPRTAARVPWGLVGMIALVAAVEAAAPRRTLECTTILVDVWTEAADLAASREVRESAILCVGDSQIKLAMQPAVLERRLGVPAFNLAVHGGQPASAYFLLRRALEAGARPKSVVVGFFPGLLASDLRINTRQWPEILGAGACLDLAWTARDLHLGTTTLLGLALRSYRAKSELRATIVAALRGEAVRERAAIAEERGERGLNRGAIVAPSKPEFADDPGPDTPPSRATVEWKPKPENERFVRRFLDLAARSGIRVYWVTSTISPAHQAARERNGLDEATCRFLRRMQAEFPGLVVLDARQLGLDRTHYIDPFHLDGRGAVTLSAAVAEAIAADDPDRSRWVSLSRRPVADDPRIAQRPGGSGPPR